MQLEIVRDHICVHQVLRTCVVTWQAHFKAFTARDEQLSRSLNSDYLGQVMIAADTSRLDPALAQPFLADPGLSDEAQTILVRKRGWELLSSICCQFAPLLHLSQCGRHLFADSAGGRHLFADPAVWEVSVCRFCRWEVSVRTFCSVGGICSQILQCGRYLFGLCWKPSARSVSGQH